MGELLIGETSELESPGEDVSGDSHRRGRGPISLAGRAFATNHGANHGTNHRKTGPSLNFLIASLPLGVVSAPHAPSDSRVPEVSGKRLQ